jgi:Metallo-peptidase family M12
MRAARRRLVATLAGTIMSAAVLMPGLALAVEPPQATTGPHATPPTGRAAQEARARNNEAPDVEHSGDITALVVTHIAYVKLALDEEWRGWYGSTGATQTATAAIETADNALFSNWGIDLRVNNVANWDSGPDNSREVCDMLFELWVDVGTGSSHIVYGFSKNLGGGTGCAHIGGDHAMTKWHGANTSERAFNHWVTTQHEISHIYNAPDQYPDPNNVHPGDVMENQYTWPSTWCHNATGFNDWFTMYDHADRFD